MVHVDTNRCIGCGICASVCPEGFKIINGKSRVVNPNASCIERAAASCPMHAIMVERSVVSKSEIVSVNQKISSTQPSQNAPQAPLATVSSSTIPQTYSYGGGFGWGRRRNWGNGQNTAPRKGRGRGMGLGMGRGKGRRYQQRGK